MDGQMSIFDFPEWLPEQKSEPKPTCEDAAECEAYPRGCSGSINPCRFGGPFKFGKPICKKSGHSCNKEELWKVAESFDDISCSRTCCRNCNTRGCGARCNGSEEPKRDPKLDIPMVPIYHESLSHVWEECPNCKGQNRLSSTKLGSSGSYYTEYADRCPDCDQKLNWDWDEIEKKAKKSADVKACEYAGISGPVNEEDLKKARELYAKRGN